MITIEKLEKYYEKKLIFKIEYFKFHVGKICLLIGENGSGKSTLIKCILKINTFNKGNIIVSENNIGYVPEKYYFPDFFTIKMFLKSIIELYNCENYDLIDYYCDYFEINKNLYISKLSKGMKQKVLIIQSLIHNSNLYIFDEPLNGLDKNMQIKFLNIIKQLKKDKKTVIITTHYPYFYTDCYDYCVKILNYRLCYENN